MGAPIDLDRHHIAPLYMGQKMFDETEDKMDAASAGSAPRAMGDVFDSCAIEIIALDALAQAAADVATLMPYQGTEAGRRTAARLYTLVRQTACAAKALVDRSAVYK